MKVGSTPSLPQAVEPTPEMENAAQGIESMFIDAMMQAMRSESEDNEFSLNNSASKMYQSMLDSEYAEIASRTKSLGISQQIIDYWLSQQYNQKR